MKQAPELLQILQDKFGDKILSSNLGGADPVISVLPDSIAEIGSFLKCHEELAFDSLMCLSGVDYMANKGETDRIEVIYHLFSMRHRHWIVLKVQLPRENPSVPTVEGLWGIANWHEREAYDMFGIQFRDHSDLRRILCPDDWVGYPLRRDYVQPATYRGMPVAPTKQFVEMAREGMPVGTDPFKTE